MAFRNSSNLYDEYYFAHGCGRPYKRDDEWLAFFDSIAEQIVKRIQPKTVLDAGCAMGFLVEGLRKRGVEAYGIDVSEFAIQNVHEDINKYCWVGSITEPFPQEYDLIVAIEVFEHLSRIDTQKAIKNICVYTEDILFSSTPFDFKEATHLNVQPPEYWADLFAQQDLFRDVDFDATFITAWARRFRKLHESFTRLIPIYERRLFLLEQENLARTEFGIEQRMEIARKESEILGISSSLAENEARISDLNNITQDLVKQITEKEFVIHDILNSRSWRLMQKFQQNRLRLIPKESRREKFFLGLLGGLDRLREEVVVTFFGHSSEKHKRGISNQSSQKLAKTIHSEAINVHPFPERAPVEPHTANVDIIICVHNALEDVRRCLESVLKHTNRPYSLIIINDGSDLETSNYLNNFSTTNGFKLIVNRTARGYTRAANQGLHLVAGDFAILLNSDTIVTPRWLDRMLTCAQSDLKIGIVGPLSNTASWQSIPKIEKNGDWATNPLPSNLSIEEMGDLVAKYTGRIYPAMKLLNGFCLMIRRQVIEEVGYFDEENFGSGYGEEDDYCLRSRNAGWGLALADDTYIYHAQSKSYSDKTRKRLSNLALNNLENKHGKNVVDESVKYSLDQRELAGIRARSEHFFSRKKYIERGQANFSGRRVLFVLPVKFTGGGANVIVSEARAMREMSVDAQILNFHNYKENFEASYPELDIPVVYSEIEEIPNIAIKYDAAVATLNTSVAWLEPAAPLNDRLVIGYYVQGYEPLIYPSYSIEYQHAVNSYILIPQMVLFSKTEWTREQVTINTGARCVVIGASVDIDLFRPRPRKNRNSFDRPLKIGAMIRAGSPYRAPELTMAVLKEIDKQFGPKIEFMLFGIDSENPEFNQLPIDFSWKNAGLITPKQAARFMNELDIFVDYSVHQAMGLSAMEGMACGAAVIVPENGGATTFAKHLSNSLVIDTSSFQTCLDSLVYLIEDNDLRMNIQRNAIKDICDFYPERSAYNILDALFSKNQ